MDVSQYLEIFIDETKEHLQNLNTEILNLEQDSENVNTINEIFRAAHSLKGMAGTMGFKRMQTLTHDMENVFSEVRNGSIKVKGNMIDILFQCLDALEEYLNIIQETGDEGTNDNDPLVKQLNEVLNSKEGGEPAKKAAEPAKKAAANDADGQKWLSIKYDETQKHVLREAVAQGKHIFGLTVKVQEACILKAARAFLVFKALEDLGEVIISNPSVQDIEDEKFDLDFSLVFITESPLEKVIQVVKSVSEIEDAQGAAISDEKIKDIAGEVMPKEEPPAPEPETVTEKPAVEKQPPVPQAGTAKGNEKKNQVSKPAVNRTVRVDIEKLDVLMNLVSELIIAKNSLVSASVGDRGTNGGVNEHIEYLESVTTNLHESVMKVRMVPIESVVSKFPRMIRDLTKKLNKKMELYMSGEDTELDRTVVDQIGDPLQHLLRNSADHGLESAELRKERGKPEVGSINLKAYQEGNNVVIEVGDDGNGIDTEHVKRKAIERGLVTPEQAENLSQKEIIDFLFMPSFSMAKKITDVSGRGVGLDVVKSNIETLGGDVEVKSKLGEGSTFIVRLPLTLAIIQALLVEVHNELFAIALGSIITIEDVPVSEIKYVQAEEVINLRGNVIPLIRLNQILDIEEPEVAPESLTVVIVNKGEKQAGLVVDNLLGQQEIVIKSLGKFISNSKIISGATILGDGEIALILDVNTLM